MTNRQELSEQITDTILQQLERGTVPWSKPWNAAGLLPTSVSTGRPYRGVNALLLAIRTLDAGFESPYWLTYKQAKSHGGTVRKGEHGTTVVFWKRLTVKDRNSEDPTATVDVPLMRAYYVFNVSQCDGLELPPRFVPKARESIDVPEAIATVVDGFVDGPQIRNAVSDRAYYTPATDTVTLPLVSEFATGEAYGGTLFHELTHSTGHASRLDRFETNGEPQHFGSARYAREELCAELGSAMLAASAGLTVDVDQNAAYIASWLGALRDDRTLVVKAAQQAQKAVDRILGTAIESEAAA